MHDHCTCLRRPQRREVFPIIEEAHLVGSGRLQWRNSGERQIRRSFRNRGARGLRHRSERVRPGSRKEPGIARCHALYWC